MQGDFHYYATYCAAVLVGYSPEEALEICYSANFVDYCSATFLRSIDAPVSAATTQLRSERANAKTNLISRQGITSNGIYKRSLYQIHENAVSNLGHRRVGRLPDYSFIRYRYMPAWGRSEEMILKDKIQTILKTRRRHASEEWWELGETIIGKKADIFDLNRYCKEYLQADEDQKESSFLGKFIQAAIAQKKMVTEKIYESRNRLAGIIEK